MSGGAPWPRIGCGDVADCVPSNEHHSDSKGLGRLHAAHVTVFRFVYGAPATSRRRIRHQWSRMPAVGLPAYLDTTTSELGIRKTMEILSGVRLVPRDCTSPTTPC